MEKKKTLSIITAGVLSLAMCGTLVSNSILESQDVEAVSEMSAIDIVNDMGSGWNLGNTFDAHSVTWLNPLTVDGLETAWGNPTTTQDMISTISDYGFETVRIPVTWYQMVDSDYTIDEDYLARIKEVVDWCQEESMYAIIDMHWDDCNLSTGNKNWLGTADSDFDSVEAEYTAIWTQIADYFKDYDNKLVFESNNEPSISVDNLMKLNQDFVDIFRSSGGNNEDRLLLISSPEANLDSACSSSFTMPDDDSNMLAVSVHYYYPTTFCVADSTSTWGYDTTWGTDLEVATMVNNFEKLKSTYVDNDIPVIIGEYGVLTNDAKDDDSIKKFLKSVAEYSKSYDGIMSILWDSGNSGDMQYFDRKNLTFFDSEIGQMYIDINESDYEPIEITWIPTEITVSDEGVVAVNTNGASKIKLEGTCDVVGSGTGAIGYWDNNANDGAGAWVQDTIYIRFDTDEDGNVTISQTDSTYETVINDGFIEIPEDADTSSIQIMYFYGGYNDEDGNWTDMTSDQYPTLTNAYIPGVSTSDDTTTTTEPSEVTTTADDSSDNWIETDINTSDDGTIYISTGGLSYVKIIITGTPSSSGTGAIGYWDNSANDGAGAWVQDTIYIRFDVDEDGNGIISQTDSEFETVIHDGFIEIPESADTDSIQVIYFYGGYVAEDGSWGTLTEYPTLSEAYVAINASDVTTSEPDDTTVTSETGDDTTVTSETGDDTTVTSETGDDTTVTSETGDDTTTVTTVTSEQDSDIILGDVNGDGSVKSNDLLLLKKYLLGLADESEINWDNSDTTGDNDIKSNDLLSLKKYLLGLADF
ncbi:MAG: cellulase family glycosylhydrolase [Ruminococcus sp.]|nr:cellulase family glycosylhydrolase [Ruminococcus sp.]